MIVEFDHNFVKNCLVMAAAGGKFENAKTMFDSP